MSGRISEPLSVRQVRPHPMKPVAELRVRRFVSCGIQSELANKLHIAFARRKAFQC
jgi:hypothetical protein